MPCSSGRTLVEVSGIRIRQWVDLHSVGSHAPIRNSLRTFKPPVRRRQRLAQADHVAARPGGTVLQGIPPVVRLASRGAPSNSMGRWTGPIIARMSEFPSRPLQTLATVQGPDRTNRPLEKSIRRLDAGQFFMAGMWFSTYIWRSLL
jgi:hypothetical protein